MKIWSSLIFIALCLCLCVSVTGAESNNQDCEVTIIQNVGDGFCDSQLGYDDYNTESCEYDGGDCCLVSCNFNGRQEFCGIADYDCKSPIYNQSQIINELQYSMFLGNFSLADYEQSRNTFQSVLFLSLSKLLEDRSDATLTDFTLDISSTIISKSLFLLNLRANITVPLDDSDVIENEILTVLNSSIKYKWLERYLRLYSRILHLSSFYFIVICSASDYPQECSLLPTAPSPRPSLSPTVPSSALNPSNTSNVDPNALNAHNWNQYYSRPSRLPLYLLFLILSSVGWLWNAVQGSSTILYSDDTLEEKILLSSLVLCSFCRFFSNISMISLYATTNYSIQSIEFVTFSYSWQYFPYIISSLWFYPLFVEAVGIIWLITMNHRFIQSLFIVFNFSLIVITCAGLFLITNAMISYEQILTYVLMVTGGCICLIEMNVLFACFREWPLRLFHGLLLLYGISLIVISSLGIVLSSTLTFFFYSLFLRVFEFLLITFIIWNLGVPGNVVEDFNSIGSFSVVSQAGSPKSPQYDARDRVDHQVEEGSLAGSEISSTTRSRKNSMNFILPAKSKSIFNDRVILDLLEPVSTPSYNHWSEYWTCTKDKEKKAVVGERQHVLNQIKIEN